SRLLSPILFLLHTLLIPSHLPSMIRLLFVSIVLFATASAKCTDAQMNTIVKCYTDFNKAYGVDDFPPFNQDYFEGFHRARSNMMNADGIAAKPAIMKYGKALTDCLAPVADCIEDSTYEDPPLSANAAAKDGHRFNLDRVQTAYECTEPGYSYQMRHYFCIVHFKALNSTTSDDPSRMMLTQCNEDRDAALDEDTNPTEAQKCKAYQDYTQCYRQVMADYCAADEAGEFYCMLVSQEYRLFSPTCAFDCKKQ
ncbi:hypothetical protein PENTCL1PPCAC_6167, partial [Pristionchus entomophagus]